MRHEFEFPAAPLAELALTAPLKAMTRPSTGITTYRLSTVTVKGAIHAAGARASTYPSAFLLTILAAECEFLYIVTTSASSSFVGLRKKPFEGRGAAGAPLIAAAILDARIRARRAFKVDPMVSLRYE